MPIDKKIVVVADDSCGWPNLTRLPNGEVICTYFNAPSHGLEEGDLVCSASGDGGMTWTRRGIVAMHPEGGNRMHLAVGLANNDDLLAFSSGFFVKDGEFTWVKASDYVLECWNLAHDMRRHIQANG